MVFKVLRAVRHLPWRPLVVAVLMLGVAEVTGRVEAWATFTTRLTVAGWVMAVGLLAWWWLRWLAPALSTGRWVDRRDDASHHAGGVATWTDIGELSSAHRLRARMLDLRPSLAGLPRWRRRRLPLTEVGVQLLRTSPVRGVNSVWSPCDEVTLRVGGPRQGKSASLTCHALDAPGALLVTTSRTDLLEDTATHRAGRGRVLIFNPTGLGTNPEDDGHKAMAAVRAGELVRWSPLAGCTDFGTATRRAKDLVPDSGASAEGERWDEQARGLLATLLHAAARSGGSMRTVLGWISPADVIARDEILDALADSPDARAMSSEIRGLYGTNDRTLSSITATLRPKLRWLLDPTLAASGDAPLTDPAFLDVAAFVAQASDSLYLIGRDGGAPTLIGALTAEVAHQVRLHAARMPRGRLDPPMTAVLDEAPITCGPIPLHEWTADMGGFNLTLHIGAQSLSQLEDVWGSRRAAAILGNVGSLMVFGGIKNQADPIHISTLTGTRLVRVDEDDARPLPVMTPAEITALPVGTALVIRNGMRPIVGAAPWLGDRRPTRTRAALTAARAATTRTVTRTVQALTTSAASTAPGPSPAPTASASEPASEPASSPAAARAERARQLRNEIDAIFARPGLDDALDNDPTRSEPEDRPNTQDDHGGAA